MRRRRRLLQSELAAEANTGQSAISRIEQETYDGWSYKTLLAMAIVLRARLRIRLEPIEDVIEEYRHSEAHSQKIDLIDAGDTSDADVKQGDETAVLIESGDDTQPMWVN
jgi:DNA-binding XRE family transcriptional regulator